MQEAEKESKDYQIVFSLATFEIIMMLLRICCELCQTMYVTMKDKGNMAHEEEEEDFGVDASYSGSLLWRNDVFPLGTFYSNAYGD